MGPPCNPLGGGRQPAVHIKKQNQSGSRSFSLAYQNQKSNPIEDDVSSGSSQPGDRRQPVVQKNKQTRSGSRSYSLASQKTKNSPTEDVSAGSPQAAGLQSMTDVGASLPPRQHPSGVRAFIAEKKRLQKEWEESQKALTATVAKRPAPGSEDRPNKRLQGGRVIEPDELPDAGVEPYPFKMDRHDIRFRPCFARVTFPDTRGTINFGSAFGQAKGTAAKVKVMPARWGDPRVTLKMAVNKSSLNEDLAGKEDEASNLKIVWQPYIKTGESYQVQEFTYRLVSESEHLKHPNVEEQARQVGKDSSGLIYVRMVTNSSQITSPYEGEYWRLLTRKGEVAARNMAICAGFMSKTERDTNVTVEFWFKSKLGVRFWPERVGASFKRCVDQGPDRMPAPDDQGEDHALEVRPADSGRGVRTPTETRSSFTQRPPANTVSPSEAGAQVPGFQLQRPGMAVVSKDKQGRARPEPTPFRPGDKVAKLVREDWSIMEAIGKVFGDGTGGSVEPQGQPEAAAQDAANVQSSNPFHHIFGDKAVSEIAQTPRERPLEPKRTQGSASLKPTPEQMREIRRRNAEMDALVAQGWSLDDAFDEVEGK